MKGREWTAILAVVGAVGAMPVDTDAQLTGTVLVANKSEATVSFVDLASSEIYATVSTGNGPHELVVSSDGRTAVVTDYGGGGRGGSTLTVIDVAAQRRQATIELGRYTRPHGIQFLPGDSLVAVTSEAGGAVVTVHVDRGEIVQVLETEASGSHMLGATADGATIWTGDMGSHTVTELSRATGGKVRSFRAPAQPEAINVTPDGTRVIAGSNGTGRITAWTTSDGQATTVAEGFGWPYRIFLTPGVERILIPDLENEVLRFFDGTTYEEIGQIDFPGEGPEGLILYPDGRHLFLSLARGNRIAIVDIESREVVGYLPAGAGPDGIGYSPLTSGPSPASR